LVGVKALSGFVCWRHQPELGFSGAALPVVFVCVETKGATLLGNFAVKNGCANAHSLRCRNTGRVIINRIECGEPLNLGNTVNGIMLCGYVRARNSGVEGSREMAASSPTARHV
jgi:hypothetical protein